MQQTHEHILTLAARIVSAHVGHNDTSADAVPGLIRKVYDTLAGVDPDAALRSQAGAPAPSAPARGTPSSHGEAVHTDHLTCLECGMTMKMLKRHLATVHDITPDEYRAKHNLAADYPMVASEYANLRSELAKKSGLGKRPESEKRRRGWR